MDGWRDLLIPALSGLGGALVTLGGSVVLALTRSKHDAVALRARTNQDRSMAAIAYTDTTTRRFEALLRAYEIRINDLTAEVAALRAEIHALRAERGHDAPAAPH